VNFFTLLKTDISAQKKVKKFTLFTHVAANETLQPPQTTTTRTPSTLFLNFGCLDKNVKSKGNELMKILAQELC
jgi:hypothetical protein